MKVYENASITDPSGYTANAARAGFKKENYDLCVIKSEVPAVSSVKFTKNAVKAAPVLKGMRSLESSGHVLQALVINSGNANAATGEQGLRDVDATLEFASKRLGVPVEHMLMSSTGLIGENLDMKRMKSGLDAILDEGLTKTAGARCARAIMTTDTREKAFGIRVDIGGRVVTFAGITKGAGMIAPNMATTLSFVTTDLAIEQPVLDEIFTDVVDHSFNMITIDGHTSTNDTALIMANGAAGNPVVRAETPEYGIVAEAISRLMTEMAMAVVRDGEGATKFVRVIVDRVDEFTNAKRMAFGVANSALVKTAIFGKDPNWGRIISAAGMVGVAFDPAKVSISINKGMVFEKGTPVRDSGEVKDLMEAGDIDIRIEVNTGQDRAVVYTSDLSYEYVRINAEYHT